MAKAGSHRVGRAAKSSPSHARRTTKTATKATTDKRQRTRGRAAVRTDVWLDVFFKELAVKGTIRAACAKAKVSRDTVWDRRKADPAFEQRFTHALADYADSLEEVADKRAKRKSDRLLEVLLRSNKPEKYKDRVEVSERMLLIWDVPEPPPM